MQRLEAELLAANRGAKGKKGRSAAGGGNEDEISRLNDRLAEQDAIIAEKKDKVTELSENVKALTKELGDEREMQKRLSDQVDELKRAREVKTNEGLQAQSQVALLSKQRKEALENLAKEQLENQKLRDTVSRRRHIHYTSSTLCSAHRPSPTPPLPHLPPD